MNFMTCSKERILLRRALIYIYCAIKSVVIGTYYVYVYHLNHLGGLKNKDSLYTIVLYLSSSHLQNFWFLAKLQNSMTVQISLQIPFAYIVFLLRKVSTYLRVPFYIFIHYQWTRHFNPSWLFLPKVVLISELASTFIFNLFSINIYFEI